jgi:choline dehydrogenase-like flavoprotein
VLTRNEKPNPPGYSIHEMGTCRMGNDARTSVLNRWNQSHDTKNLYVVDASCFVSSGWQNPTLTLTALAMRAADHLAGQLQRGEL